MINHNQRHETSSIRYISALLALCVESPPVTGGFPFQRSVTRSFGIVFDLRLNKWLSKQSRCRWFETPWRSLSRQKWITQFLYRNHELVTNVRTFAQISMIGEFYGLCQSVIEFVNWTQIINNNWNTSRVGLYKDARVNSLIHKHMREGYKWMIRYNQLQIKTRKWSCIVRSYMLLKWRTGIIFQIRNWLYCLTAFENHTILLWDGIFPLMFYV